MVNNVTMKGRDTIAAKLAECYLTINTRRYNFMQMIDLEAKVDKDKTTVPCLGRVMKGHKSCGMEGTFSGTAHYNQSELRQALLDYKNTGEDVYFEMQITNDDPDSAAGRQTIVFYDCNMDGGTLAKFDADGEYLDEDITALPMRDILNRLERYLIITSADEWTYIRELRNEISHDYPLLETDVAAILNELFSKTDIIFSIYSKLKSVFNNNRHA